MADQQISQYIQQQLRKGFSSSKIRTFLVGHGYNAPDVDAALNAVMRDRVNSLTSYVKGERAKGFNPADIRVRLQQYGYAAGDIDTAMAAAAGTPVAAIVLILLILALVGGAVFYFGFTKSSFAKSPDTFQEYDEFKDKGAQAAPEKIAENKTALKPKNESAAKKPDQGQPSGKNGTSSEGPLNESAGEEPVQPAGKNGTAAKPPQEEPIVPAAEEPEEKAAEPKKEPPAEIRGTVREEDVARAAEICRSNTNEIYRDSCFDQVSKAAGDPEFCSNIISTERKDDCYMRFVIKDDNFALCEKLEDAVTHDLCVSLEP